MDRRNSWRWRPWLLGSYHDFIKSTWINDVTPKTTKKQTNKKNQKLVDMWRESPLSRAAWTPEKTDMSTLFIKICMWKKLWPKIATNISHLYLGLSFHILFLQNTIVFTWKILPKYFLLISWYNSTFYYSYYILWC